MLPDINLPPNCTMETIVEHKKINLYVAASATANFRGPAGYGAVLSFHDGKKLHQKELSNGYAESLTARVTMRGIIAGLLSLKSSCEVRVFLHNDIIINAFEKGWVLNWREKGLLGRPTQKIQHTDLYALLLDAMDGHAVTYHHGDLSPLPIAMERAKDLARKAKRNADLLPDNAEYPGQLF